MNSKPIRNLYLRFDADNAVGSGHLKRCVSIGELAVSKDIRVYWVSKNLTSDLEAILPNRYESLVRIDPNLSWSEEAAWLCQNLSSDNAAIVLDVTTAYALKKQQDFSCYLGRLNRHCRTVLFDGIGMDSILNQIDEKPHIGIVPYIGATLPSGYRQSDCQWLLGPRYFVLHKSYEDAVRQTKRIEKQARKILITFGGTDPKAGTLLALDAVAALNDSTLEIRTVIGPGYSESLKKEINKKASLLGKACRLEESPDDLAQLISWCDVAISASGLTKYEIAALGTPSIQLSFCKEHAQVGHAFNATGATIHLGVIDDLSIQDLESALEEVLRQQLIRQRMNSACIRIMDEKGTARVLDAICSAG